jgi:osmotically-inducible protein OsmY
MPAKSLLALAALLLAFSVGCNTNRANTRDVKGQVSKALENAGLKDVGVTADDEKQLVTLKGDVKTQEDKERAEEVAKSAAGGWVVANEIGIRPEGVEGAARKIDSNVDSAIEKDFKAVLIANRLDDEKIRYDVKNGVLKLHGEVSSPEEREKVEKLAATVPNVQQVVNELDINTKHRKRHAGAGGE